MPEPADTVSMDLHVYTSNIAFPRMEYMQIRNILVYKITFTNFRIDSWLPIYRALRNTIYGPFYVNEDELAISL